MAEKARETALMPSHVRGDLKPPSLGGTIDHSELRDCSLFVDNTDAAIEAARQSFDDVTVIAPRPQSASRGKAVVKASLASRDGPLIAYPPREKETQQRDATKRAPAVTHRDQAAGIVRSRQQQKELEEELDLNIRHQAHPEHWANQKPQDPSHPTTMDGKPAWNFSRYSSQPTATGPPRSVPSNSAPVVPPRKPPQRSMTVLPEVAPTGPSSKPAATASTSYPPVDIARQDGRSRPSNAPMAGARGRAPGGDVHAAHLQMPATQHHRGPSAHRSAVALSPSLQAGDENAKGERKAKLLGSKKLNKLRKSELNEGLQERREGLRERRDDLKEDLRTLRSRKRSTSLQAEPRAV